MIATKISLLVALILPWVCAIAAKMDGGFRIEHNRHPREFLRTLEGRAARWHAAQQNSFEILPGYVAAVLLGQAAQVDGHLLGALGLLFIAMRLAYIACYVKDWASMRSLCWFVSVACVVAMIVIAIAA